MTASTYLTEARPNNRSGAQSVADRDFDFAYDLLMAAIVLAAPLVVYGFAAGGFSVRFSRILIVLMLPLAVLRAATRPRLILRDKFLLYGFVPYLFYCTVSIAWSPNVETGTWPQRLGGLYEIFLLYVYLILADLNPERFRRFVTLYVASAILPLSVSAWQIANNVFQFSGSELPFDRFVIAGKYAVLEGRYFVAAGGFSRISGTFAEPVIYSNYLVSVLLLSLVLQPESRRFRLLVTGLRAAALIVIVLCVSKLALISITVGLTVISLRDKRVGKLLAAVIGAFVAIVAVMAHYGLLLVFSRLLSESGHYELLIETLQTMTHSNLLLGQGIGSVPYGSFHRFVLSRVYEAGLIGLLFTVFVTLNPVRMMFLRVASPLAQREKVVATGAFVALVLGLHSYDFFIHLWPWTVTGAVMSYYYQQTSLTRLFT